MFSDWIEKYKTAGIRIKHISNNYYLRYICQFSFSHGFPNSLRLFATIQVNFLLKEFHME